MAYRTILRGLAGSYRMVKAQNYLTNGALTNSGEIIPASHP